MASLFKRSGSPNHAIAFYTALGTRHTVSLRGFTKQQARAFRVQVEKLEAAARSAQEVDAATLKWAAALPDGLYDKLAKPGLVPQRISGRLAEWLANELGTRRRSGGIQESSLVKLQQTATKLVQHFGARRAMRSITPADAECWCAWMRQTLSEATVRTHSGNAKGLFRKAREQGVVIDEPFRKLRSGSTPRVDQRHVSLDDIARVIEACPTAEWKAQFALTRYAGCARARPVCCGGKMLIWIMLACLSRARRHAAAPAGHTGSSPCV